MTKRQRIYELEGKLESINNKLQWAESDKERYRSGIEKLRDRLHDADRKAESAKQELRVMKMVVGAITPRRSIELMRADFEHTVSVTLYDSHTHLNGVEVLTRIVEIKRWDEA